LKTFAGRNNAEVFYLPERAFSCIGHIQFRTAMRTHNFILQLSAAP
jgi:hypothetical protein